MSEHDLHVGEVDRHVVDQHRLAPLQAHAAAAGQPRAHARMAGVEDRRQLVCGDHLVDRVADGIGRMDVLHDAVEFEPPHPVILNEVARFARTHLASARIDRSERNDDVVVPGGVLGDFVVADAPGADAALAVDREQAERNLLLAIQADDLGNPGPLARRLEISGRRIEEPAHDRILGVVARHLGMHVDVDRADLGQINHAFRPASWGLSVSPLRSPLPGRA